MILRGFSRRECRVGSSCLGELSRGGGGGGGGGKQVSDKVGLNMRRILEFGEILSHAVGRWWVRGKFFAVMSLFGIRTHLLATTDLLLRASLNPFESSLLKKKG